MLTKSEEEIMKLLWNSSEPLTSTEIVKKSVDKSWKDSYVHLLINSLMSKGLIEVASFKKSTKNYARAFKPTVSREKYLILSLTRSKSYAGSKKAELFKVLIESTTDPKLLDELEKIIRQRKAELTA